MTIDSLRIVVVIAVGFIQIKVSTWAVLPGLIFHHPFFSQSPVLAT
jgi:hypothetical protein